MISLLLLGLITSVASAPSVSCGAVASVPLTPLGSGVGALRISSDVLDARVAIDGVDAGRAPLVTERVCGRHLVTVRGVAGEAVTVAVNLSEVGALVYAPLSKQVGVYSDVPISNSTHDVKPVRLDLFVRALDPFGARGIAALGRVVEGLGGSVEVGFDLVAEMNPDGTVVPARGPDELAAARLSICAARLFPRSETYLPFLKCANKAGLLDPMAWKPCASTLGLNAEALLACADGEEGRRLVRSSVRRTLDRGVAGSPSLYIDGHKHIGGRAAADYLRAACDRLEAPLPPACGGVERAISFRAWWVSDRRCEACDLAKDKTASWLRSMFPRVLVLTADVKDSTGRLLFERSGEPLLPALVLEKIAASDPSYSLVDRLVKTHDDFLLLTVGGEFDPRREICDNGVDDTGNGHNDCDDEDCKGSLLCREDVPKQLELFVMSGCPFGVTAENAMKDVLDAFKSDGVSFRIHYIIKQGDDGLQSVHGPWELEEDTRQLCAASQAPARYFDYILCRNGNIRDAEGWRRCATKTGLDVLALERCVSGEQGRQLAEADAELAESLKITASPTFLSNNRFDFHALSPEAIKRAFCKRNLTLKGCSMTLSDVVPDGAGVCR